MSCYVRDHPVDPETKRTQHKEIETIIVFFKYAYPN